MAKMELNTERTILIPVDIEMMNAISNGMFNQLSEYYHNDEWPEDDLKEALPVFMELLKENGIDGFNMWLIVEKKSHLVIGSAGYIGKPDDEGNIEIGFGIISKESKKDFCFESVSALLKWGLRHDEVNGIIAKCDKSNIASRNTIVKLGFEFICDNDDLLTWILSK